VMNGNKAPPAAVQSRHLKNSDLEDHPDGGREIEVLKFTRRNPELEPEQKREQGGSGENPAVDEDDQEAPGGIAAFGLLNPAEKQAVERRHMSRDRGYGAKQDRDVSQNRVRLDILFCPIQFRKKNPLSVLLERLGGLREYILF